MSSFKRFLALPLAFYLAAAAAPAQTDPLFEEIDSIMADLTKITGLAPLRKVPCSRIEKSQVRQFLDERVKESIKPEEIRAEELALKKFGFAPPDFDLKKTTLDMLSEQAAAFYDYRKQKLFVIDSGNDITQHAALVHELAHALADQHFHLRAFIESASKSDDSALARMAVMEGQATWLMSEYLTQRSGQSLKTSPVLLKMMANASDVASGQFPVFDRAPLYLRETLLFPYAQGMLFQHAVVEKLDRDAFASVFRNPPTTTQQVLHPEKYFEGVRPPRPPLPEIGQPGKWRTMLEGGFGELDSRILLKQHGGEENAPDQAKEWRGGYFRLAENKRDSRVVLQLATEWSSPESAKRFFRLYQNVLKSKWKNYRPETAVEDAVLGRGDDGYFALRLQGTRVTSVEGLAGPALH